jgi:serine/threonine protein kinase
MTFGIGDTIGTYKIVAAIGSGGMGEVFQVEHVITKRVEAMKILAAEASGVADRDQRFLREIQLQAALSHPNIAAVHNAFWESGHLIMIMELIEGHSLRRLLYGERLPLAASIDYACQALYALDYAHGVGVVHRDISPANMIVTEEGTLKLTDFGLAKSLNDIRITQSGTLLGSLYYTSPEQVRGAGNIDARADIYSLGAVLYEMAAGAKLFHSENPFTLMLAHVEQPPPRPSEVDPSLPPVMDEILLKALSKDPEKRFQSAELFRCALESVKDGWNEYRGARPLAERIYDDARWAAPPTQSLLSTPPPPVTSPASSIPPAIPPWRYLKVAAVCVLALLFSYVWKGAQFTASTVPIVTPAPDFAALPMTWPSDLMQTPQLTYAAPRRRPVRRTSATTRSEVIVTDDNGVQRKIDSDGKSHNPFLRAVDRVVHPLRHSASNHRQTAAKVSSEPDVN